MELSRNRLSVKKSDPLMPWERFLEFWRDNPEAILFQENGIENHKKRGEGLEGVGLQ
jgi:hypothetical protein